MTHLPQTLLKKLKDLEGSARRFLSRERTHQELMVLFLVAVVFGFSLKSLIRDSLTIGFDDYRLGDTSRLVDLNLLQKEVLNKDSALATKKAVVASGEACSETTD